MLDLQYMLGGCMIVHKLIVDLQYTLESSGKGVANARSSHMCTMASRNHLSYAIEKMVQTVENSPGRQL